VSSTIEVLVARLTLSKLREYEVALGEKFSGFSLRFKDESSLMKALGFLVSPFNPKFQDMTTVLGQTVYFPSRIGYESDPTRSFVTLFHESVHMWDGENNPAWFRVSYLFPQILALLPALLFAVLSWPHFWLLLLPLIGYVASAFLAANGKGFFWVSLTIVSSIFAIVCASIVGLPSLVLLLSAALLVPWPSPFRTHWELRGYTATIAAHLWLTGEISEDRLAGIAGHFTGPSYFYMSWDGDGAEQSVSSAVRSTAILQSLQPYSFTYEFLLKHNLLHRG
jgi:hypothetical protein